MSAYQVMYWKDFPAQISVSDDEEHAKAMLPDRFHHAIDAAAMREGSTDADTYLDGWCWGPKEIRDGSAHDVLHALLAEFDANYPPERLAEMVRAHDRNERSA